MTTGVGTQSPHLPGLSLTRSQHHPHHNLAARTPCRHRQESRVEAGHHPAPPIRGVTTDIKTSPGAVARQNERRSGTGGEGPRGEEVLPLEEGIARDGAVRGEAGAGRAGVRPRRRHRDRGGFGARPGVNSRQGGGETAGDSRQHSDHLVQGYHDLLVHVRTFWFEKSNGEIGHSSRDSLPCVLR